MSAIRTFRRLFAPKSRPAGPARTARRPLRCETLEAREVPAAYVSGGTLYIDGTNAQDVVKVEYKYVATSGQFQYGSSPKYVVTQNGAVQQFSPFSITTGTVRFTGLGGDDKFDNSASGLQAVADGGSGNDTLMGGWYNDQLRGGPGNDLITGGDGRDDLYGDQGDDRLYGASDVNGVEAGESNDTLAGGDGRDSLWGGYGADFLIGGNDADWLDGQWGNDMVVGSNWDYLYNMPDAAEVVTVFGSSTNDTLFGSNGVDSLYGGFGQDQLSGGFDSDELYGQEGNDRLWGAFSNSPLERPNNPNNDSLYGGPGADSLYGGEGDDRLVGGDDYDELSGEDGYDLLVGSNWDGGADRPDPVEAGYARDFLYGGYNNDTLYGGWGDDYLFGGSNDDRLFGEDGQDTLYGQDGNDDLFGGTEADTLYGGAGLDGLFGGIGWIDRLYGEGDSDRFLLADNQDTFDVVGSWSFDARLNFYNGGTGEFGGTTYVGEDWTDRDVQRVDDVLRLLHQVAGGPALLRTAWGADLQFARHDGWARGYNDGAIHLTDFVIDNGDQWLRGYVLHEIGHSMEGFADLDAFGALSGWTHDDPEDPNYTRSPGQDLGDPDDDWWYRTGTGFASGYAMTNRSEDFAESFAAYLTSLAFIYDYDGREWAFYNGVGTAGSPEKTEFMSSWLAGM